MTTPEDLEQELKAIKERNRRVEADKAWETSHFRSLSVVLLTYIVMVIFLYSIKVERFWLSALVPTLGFFLSTQSLPILKRWWLAHNYHKTRGQ